LIQSYKQTLSIYYELNRIGFGLKELTLLYPTIEEISAANNIPMGSGVEKFFKDIDDNYDDWLGFESKINGLKQQLDRIRMQSSLYPVVGQMLLRLVQNGVNEEEIITIADLLRNDFSSRPDSKIQTGRSLIDDVRQYGSIKSTTYHLAEESDKLKKQVSSLQTEQLDLQSNNHKLQYLLQYSKKILDFFQESIDSLEKDAVRLFSFITVVSMSFQLSAQQSEGITKMQDTNLHDEFEPLRQTARGQQTDLPELKLTVAKAIALLLVGMGLTDNKVTRALIEARLLLLCDIST
jgi:hypothetical protein